MLQENNITNLIDIQDAIINKVEMGENNVHIYFQLERRTQSCPCCQGLTDKVHDYRTQIVKDLPIQYKNTYLHYRKRRYICPCCNKKFYEKLHILPKRYRITNRVALYSLNRLTKRISIKDIASELNVSSSSVIRWLNNTFISKPNILPKVLSIDEFKGNSGGEKFQCILTDAKNKKVVDILHSRKQEDLFGYFTGFKHRDNVNYVVIDMSRAFKEVARKCFPNAKLVIDKFHVARQATWAFENTRKRVQKNLSSELRKYFKRSRKLLTMRINQLKKDDILAVEKMLSCSVDLANAYLLKEYFYNLMDSKDRHQAIENLKWFKLQAKHIDLPEYKPVLTMLNNWEEYILNAFEYKYSNGYTEGTNNSIKVIKRVGFGYRNFENFRKRILLVHS